MSNCVFNFSQWIMQDDPGTYSSCQILDFEKYYEIVIETGIRAHELRFCVSKHSLEAIKNIVKHLNWNKEYFSKNPLMDADGWMLQVDFPEVTFSSCGNRAYPTNYEYIRGMILDEIHWLFRKYGPLSSFDTDLRMIEAEYPPTIVRAKQYYVYASYQTGDNGYKYFYDHTYMGELHSNILPKNPIYIFNDTIKMYSEWNAEMDEKNCKFIYNGDSTDGELCAKVFYRGNENYVLQTPVDWIEIQHDGDQYLFFQENKLIAKMSKAQNMKKRHLLDDQDSKLLFTMSVLDELPVTMALLMLSVPLL